MHPLRIILSAGGSLVAAGAVLAGGYGLMTAGTTTSGAAGPVETAGTTAATASAEPKPSGWHHGEGTGHLQHQHAAPSTPATSPGAPGTMKPKPSGWHHGGGAGHLQHGHPTQTPAGAGPAVAAEQPAETQKTPGNEVSHGRNKGQQGDLMREEHAQGKGADQDTNGEPGNQVSHERNKGQQGAAKGKGVHAGDPPAGEGGHGPRP